MATIRPVSELQRKIGELCSLAADSKEPVYLTKRGQKYLVLVDADRYDELQKAAEEKSGGETR